MDPIVMQSQRGQEEILLQSQPQQQAQQQKQQAQQQQWWSRRRHTHARVEQQTTGGQDCTSQESTTMSDCPETRMRHGTCVACARAPMVVEHLCPGLVRGLRREFLPLQFEQVRAGHLANSGHG